MSAFWVFAASVISLIGGYLLGRFDERIRTPLRIPKKAAAVLAQREDGCILALDHSTRGICLPCGKCQPGEHPSIAAVREAYEETGCMVELLPDSPFVAIDVDGHQVTTYKATIISLRPALVMDFREGQPCWVAPSRLLTGQYAWYNAGVLKHFNITY